MFIVGLAGGIGSGKTAVSDRFAQKGIVIVDADVCSRVVVEPGKPALNAIAEKFGNDILLENGELDRAALRTKIFSSPDDKAWLEGLLHPLIAEELFRQLEAAESPYVIMVSPLLVESQQNLFCDKVVVVDVPESVQLERTMSRDDNDADQVKRIMETQASRQTRLEAASHVIENTQGLDHLDKEVSKLHKEFLTLAKEKAEKATEQ